VAQAVRPCRNIRLALPKLELKCLLLVAQVVELVELVEEVSVLPERQLLGVQQILRLSPALAQHFL
jgi:hypothetical protein